MKKFKVGKYYIFNKNGKKIGKVKIYALVEIDGILHAVFTYYLDAIKPIRTLPVEIEGETQTIHFGEAAGYYLSAAAPVPLKPAKFQVGKKYFYYDDDDYENEIFINAKYIDPKDKAVTVVFEDVAVRIVKLDPDGNEYIDCNDSEDGSIKAINEVKEKSKNEKI